MSCTSLMHRCVVHEQEALDERTRAMEERALEAAAEAAAHRPNDEL